MVLKRAITHLRGRPKDERVAVAGGIATAVAILLLVSWAVFFFKNIQSGAVQIQAPTGLKEKVFNMQAVNDAQQQLLDGNQ